MNPTLEEKVWVVWREAGSLNPTLEEKVWVVWREAGSLNPPDPLSKGGGAKRVKNSGQKLESKNQVKNSE